MLKFRLGCYRCVGDKLAILRCVGDNFSFHGVLHTKPLFHSVMHINFPIAEVIVEYFTSKCIAGITDRALTESYWSTCWWQHKYVVLLLLLQFRADQKLKGWTGQWQEEVTSWSCERGSVLVACISFKLLFFNCWIHMKCWTCLFK